MLITVKDACELLGEKDNILILAHQRPDGDTLGASFALLRLLEKQGKTARVECADPFPARFDYLCGGYRPTSFTPRFVVGVDVASLSLLGQKADEAGEKIDLCIDHHKSNELYAEHTLLGLDAAATAELIYQMAVEWGMRGDSFVANAIYTAISTDTGCFKYDNTTAATHRIAAATMEWGAEYAMINKLMFETKSKGRLEVDKLVMDSLQYFMDGRCAMVTVGESVPEDYGVTEDELDGISALPRKIEGVLVGVTVREKKGDAFRISIRTATPIDASKICSRMGGGGHMNAAGCTLDGELEQVKTRILSEVEKELNSRI